MKRLWPLLLCVCCVGPVWADARASIQGCYDKLSEAAHLKYVDGLFAIRTPHYKAFAPNGKPLDLRGEHIRYQNLFSSALSVSEHVDILSFRQLDAKHAQCQTHDVLQVVLLSKAATPLLWTVDGEGQDDWVLTPTGWLQTATHLSQQKFTTAPAPPDMVPSH